MKRKALPGDPVTADKVCPVCDSGLEWKTIKGRTTWYCTGKCGAIPEIWLKMAMKSPEMAQRLDGHYYKARLCHERLAEEMAVRRLGVKTW